MANQDQAAIQQPTTSQAAQTTVQDPAQPVAPVASDQIEVDPVQAAALQDPNSPPEVVIDTGSVPEPTVSDTTAVLPADSAVVDQTTESVDANQQPEALETAGQSATVAEFITEPAAPAGQPQEVQENKVSDVRKYDEVIDQLVNAEGGVDVGGLLEEIVKKALEEKSSDVHIEPREQNVVIRFRVDGLLREVMTIDKKLEQALVFKIKVASRLRTDEHFAPQDGKIRFVFDDMKVDTRVSILPTTKGEKIVFRLLTQQGKAFGLEDLGIVGRDLEIVQKSFTKPYGMIVAAGPTGSGKTTTLYSILKILNDPDINITTIEDPVEYDIDGINHVQVNAKANMTFATGLRSLLRQDPDILMIGEIRDGETARIAINSAMTGHLVLSTIHTNDAVTTVPRLIDMGIEPYLVSSTINVVIAQRLARKLCESCKTATTISPEEHAEIQTVRPDIAALLKPGDPMHKAGSCATCGGVGYKGRIGLYEVLEVNKAVRDQINAGASADEIFKAARESGLTLIVEDGIKKVKLGIISIDELQRVTAIKEE